jgi:hypothetical protein
MDPNPPKDFPPLPSISPTNFYFLDEEEVFLDLDLLLALSPDVDEGDL